jgi:hypothetical protein
MLNEDQLTVLLVGIFQDREISMTPSMTSSSRLGSF